MSDYGTGLSCPVCGVTETKVMDSRAYRDDNGVRRRRLCTAGHRFTTAEIAVGDEGVVIRPGSGTRPPQIMPLASWNDRFIKAAYVQMQTMRSLV